MYLAKSLSEKLFLLQVIFVMTVQINSALCLQVVEHQSPTNHLVLFPLTQYPVRPATMTYDDVQHLAAKIKPKQQRVHLFSPFAFEHPSCSRKSL